MFKFAKTDIDYQLAFQAYSGTSMVPGKRAEQCQAGYVEDMQDMVAYAEGFVTDDNRAAITTDLLRYKETYLKKYNAMLHAKSRCMSAMIVGPSNFPTRSNNKRNETERKRADEFLEFCDKARERFRKEYDPVAIANRPIRSDDHDAIEQLKKKIDEAAHLQEIMKAANKIIRDKKTDRLSKVVELSEIGVNNTEGIFEPDCFGQIGFASYSLTNNNANIRRMKQRLIALEREAARECADDRIVNGVTISENTGIQRLQLFFDGKPSEDIRKELKSSGFRWSPKEGAWQRLLNDNARRSLRYFEFLKEGE